MPVRSVLTLGDPRLREKSARVENYQDPGLKTLVADMVDTMRAYDGVGLAAPQIGIRKRIVVIEVDNNPRYPGSDNIPLLVLFNPEITSFWGKPESAWEGCLSLPGLRGKVYRSPRIHFHAVDRDGQPINTDANGFFARILQHEIDHLDGVVYPDRMENLHDFGFEKSLPEFR